MNVAKTVERLKTEQEAAAAARTAEESAAAVKREKARADGMGAGRAWAADKATQEELRDVGRYVRPSQTRMPYPYRDRVVKIIRQAGFDDRENGFVDGFCAGAVEVWDEVKSRL